MENPVRKIREELELGSRQFCVKFGSTSLGLIGILQVREDEKRGGSSFLGISSSFYYVRPALKREINFSDFSGSLSV